MSNAQIVAVGLLTQRHLDLLGANFHRLWPVDETLCFAQLLQAIDEADREMWRQRDEAESNRAEAAPSSANAPPRA